MPFFYKGGGVPDLQHGQFIYIISCTRLGPTVPAKILEQILIVLTNKCKSRW